MLAVKLSYWNFLLWNFQSCLIDEAHSQTRHIRLPNIADLPGAMRQWTWVTREWRNRCATGETMNCILTIETLELLQPPPPSHTNFLWTAERIQKITRLWMTHRPATRSAFYQERELYILTVHTKLEASPMTQKVKHALDNSKQCEPSCPQS